MYVIVALFKVCVVILRIFYEQSDTVRVSCCRKSMPRMMVPSNFSGQTV